MPLDWPTSVLTAIKRECDRNRSARFSRQPLIDHELDQIVSETKSTGATPSQTLSRILQTLRDRGQIQFLGGGDYLLVGFRQRRDLPVTNAEQKPPESRREVVASEIDNTSKKVADVGIAFDVGASTSPDRSDVIVRRIIRDTKIVAGLKELYEFRCQLCGLTIELKDGLRYCEAHHIRPLGQPHNGPDATSNLIIVCPNHHAMLDYASIQICLTKLVYDLHEIDSKQIDYHNTVLHGSRSSAD